MSKPADSPMLLPKRSVLDRQNPEHILSLIGNPSSDERKALREIVADADLFEVDGVPGLVFLLAPVSQEIVDILAAFEAEHEELHDIDVDEGDRFGDLEEDDPQEDSDEDRCLAYDDNPKARVRDSKPGDGEDAEAIENSFGNPMVGRMMLGKNYMEKTPSYLPGDPRPDYVVFPGGPSGPKDNDRG